MGKDKLRKFAENLTFENLVQPEFEDIFRRDHALKGRWAADFFNRGGNNGNGDQNGGESEDNRPIVLELGCGKGEYTVGLGAAHPNRNFIGIDIKGARMWRGAKTATEMGLRNVGFLRTRIEFINSFFGPGEVSEIWITFPDPQLKKGREKKRLTSPVFLEYYARFLAPGGVIHLKTDSRELHDYTLRVIEANGLPCEVASTDIYNNYELRVTSDESAARGERAQVNKLAPTGAGLVEANPTLFAIKTAYERRFLAEGKPITYLRFGLGDRRRFEMVYDE
jgi:tRNA (guanine-N7-)-methyltransferase